MKTKLPFLIAAGLLLASVTKAQYGAPCANDRIVIRAHVGFPLPVPVPVVEYSNHYPSRVVYEHPGYDDRFYDNRGYNNQHDWRAVAYERYCHENRGYRMSREEFYRDHCDNNRGRY